MPHVAGRLALALATARGYAHRAAPRAPYFNFVKALASSDPYRWPPQSRARDIPSDPYRHIRSLEINVPCIGALGSLSLSATSLSL